MMTPRLALLLALTCQEILAFTTVGRTNVKAFVPAVTSFGASTKDKSGVGMVAGRNKEKSMANPSTAFGFPLDDNVKDFNRFTVDLIKGVVFDSLFSGHDRDYARFYALETIARMPYFSYLAVLHFYETTGRWRKSNYLKIHFAENWNELHHLKIMEDLGGADRWFDRFIAQHVAVFYYWIIFFIYLYNPTIAYNLNQVVEEHAFATYDQFLKDKGEELKKLPAPQIAKDYYHGEDLYMFDDFQTGTCEVRRPVIRNLYDVFVAIRDDEAEHVKTMTHLQTDQELSNIHDGTCLVPEEVDVPFWADNANEQRAVKKV